MNLKSYPILMGLAALSLYSCSKSSSAPAISNPIVGLWIGTLTAHNEPDAGPLYYAFDLKSDSTMQGQSEGADGNTYYSTGTWSISGSSFKATLTTTTGPNKGVITAIAADYSNNNNTLTGTWQGQDGGGYGAFTLNRVN